MESPKKVHVETTPVSDFLCYLGYIPMSFEDYTPQQLSEWVNKLVSPKNTLSMETVNGRCVFFTQTMQTHHLKELEPGQITGILALLRVYKDDEPFPSLPQQLIHLAAGCMLDDSDTVKLVNIAHGHTRMAHSYETTIAIEFTL